MITKETLLKEAIEVFQKEGVSHFTLEELLGSLNINSSTFEENFKDKKDLLRQAMIHEQNWNRERDKKLSKKASNALEYLLMLISRGIEDLKKVNPQYITDVVKDYPDLLEEQSQRNYQYSYDLIHRILNEGIKDGLFKRSMNPDIVTKVMISNVNVLADQNAFPADEYEVNEVFRCIYLYYVRGLCTEKAFPLVEQYFAYLV